MKNLKVDFLFAAALLLGSSLAFATASAPKAADPAFGKINGAWEPISPSYTCSASTDDCTATALVGGEPQGVVKGTYAR